MKRARKHHYIPEFYLRRFADGSGKVSMHRRSKAKPFLVPARTAAHELDFYTGTAGDGEPTLVVEELLGKIESNAAPALDHFVKNGFPLSRFDREAISLFIGMQLVRTPEFRRGSEAIADAAIKGQILSEIRHLNRDAIRDFLVEHGLDSSDDTVDAIYDFSRDPSQVRVAPSKNDLLKQMVTIGLDAGKTLEQMSWHVLRCPAPYFLTSDHPVVFLPPRDSEGYPGLGMLTAEAIVFPIDPQHLLMMLHDDLRNNFVLDVSRDVVEACNRLVAHNCLQFTIHHPSHEAMRGIVLAKRRPIMQIYAPEFIGTQTGEIYVEE